MKKYFFILLFLIGLNSFVHAEEQNYNIIQHDDSIVYSLVNSTWSHESKGEDEITFKKCLYEGAGSHSIYNKEDGSLGFALATDCELISNNSLIIVDNNLLKYYKLNYNYGDIEQMELTDEEINKIFPDAEIFKMSQIEDDNKIWLHKPFRKSRILLLVNDTDKFFHGFTCDSKNTQDTEIKGLINISKYGIIRFSHFGEYKGNLTFYIR